MQIQVYYNSDSVSFKPYDDDYVPDRTQLEYIGTIEAESIDEVWALLQHTDSRTSPPIIEDRRSACVGDVFKTPDDFYLVKWLGFKKLNW